MPADQGTPNRVRLPIRMDRYVATVDVPVHLADGVGALLVDQVRASPDPVGHLVHVADDGALTVDGRLWDAGDDQTIFDQLIYVLMQASLDDDAARLHLHAGFVGKDDRGVLLAGTPGSGKSTLIAQMVADGCDYFTDERVALDRDRRLAPLPKPISVAYASSGPLGAFASAVERTGGAQHRLWHLPASAIRAGAVGETIPKLAAIVVVEFRPGAPLEHAVLHPVTAAGLLLADAIDAQRFGTDGPMLTVQLCSQVPCFRLVHGGGDDARQFIQTLVTGTGTGTGTGTAATEDVVRVVGGRRPAWKGAVRLRPQTVVGRARGIDGAVAGERCLLRTAAGALVELDETLTAWFLLLDGSSTLDGLVREVAQEADLDPIALMANAVAIVEHLASLGVAA